MTDYNSQGRTLQYNIVNPSCLRDYLAIYTAMSRGTSSVGTALMQPINNQGYQW